MNARNIQSLKDWLDANNISLKEFEGLSGVPYQRISEHIRLNKPLSEKYVAMILKATNCNVSPESLRPSIKPIFELISTKSEVRGDIKIKQEIRWFPLGLAIIMGVFAITILIGPTGDITDVVKLESQQHYAEAQKAVSEGNLELALTHLEAIKERTPAWYNSRELHWKVKEDLNTYAQTKAQAVQ